jgi:hypothetical protein
MLPAGLVQVRQDIDAEVVEGDRQARSVRTPSGRDPGIGAHISFWPQFVQNCASGSLVTPQFGHVRSSSGVGGTTERSPSPPDGGRWRRRERSGRCMNGTAAGAVMNHLGGLARGASRIPDPVPVRDRRRAARAAGPASAGTEAPIAPTTPSTTGTPAADAAVSGSVPDLLQQNDASEPGGRAAREPLERRSSRAHPARSGEREHQQDRAAEAERGRAGVVNGCGPRCIRPPSRYRARP